jgi:hypothetical protein
MGVEGFLRYDQNCLAVTSKPALNIIPTLKVCSFQKYCFKKYVYNTYIYI